MQVEFLKEIVLSVAGQSSVGIIDLLFKKKNVNEFLIAKKLNLTINQTRNILYKLADEGLVSFVRKKDSKKGGWYTYFWTLNVGKSLARFSDKLFKDIENLKNQANSRKTKTFYYCKNCQIEYSEENALLYDYTCPECGEILEVKDNTKDIESIEREISKFTRLLEKVDIELVEIDKVEGKTRDRRYKADLRKKADERLKRKKIREKEMRKAGIFKTKKSKKKVKKKKIVRKKTKKRRKR